MVNINLIAMLEVILLFLFGLGASVATGMMVYRAQQKEEEDTM
jgi:hypothetical protein